MKCRDFVGLKNGSYLLPSTDYAEHKRVLEAVKLLERANAEPVNAPK